MYLHIGGFRGCELDCDGRAVGNYAYHGRIAYLCHNVDVLLCRVVEADKLRVVVLRAGYYGETDLYEVYARDIAEEAVADIFNADFALNACYGTARADSWKHLRKSRECTECHKLGASDAVQSGSFHHSLIPVLGSIAFEDIA